MGCYVLFFDFVLDFWVVLVVGGLWGQTYFFSIRAKCHITPQSRILRQLACCSCYAVTARHAISQCPNHISC